MAIMFAMRKDIDYELDIVVKDNPTLYRLQWFTQPHRAKNLEITNCPMTYLSSGVTHAENVNLDIPAAHSVWINKLEEVSGSIKAITAGEVLMLKSLKKVGSNLTLSHGYTFRLNADITVVGCARLAYPEDKESDCLTNEALIARGNHTFTDETGMPIRPLFY
ncbi:hypothetical protein DSO57_1033559 [Entomophthora muscae]|uniref:Uncharacterized protein n=1 Tax=Entomophthora muscae TaxID=34485 RepID=A0ACC2RET1_9FUNG|nr:hypothetical protein DSO57_1033559 [Entomophthora muscae]